MAGFAIEISSPNAAPFRKSLAGQNLIVGRAKEAQIFLDSRTISRRHAELNCDPFGRWWVRDLGSHNGTLVNGARVTEKILNPGDSIQVGEFTMAVSSVEDTRPSFIASSAIRPALVESDSG